MTNHAFKTGVCREQPSFLPPRVEDYVDRSNPVRAIEAYVDALDLEKLGFRLPGSGGGAGQPAYDPADLLKLYVYGYLNRVRSSRRLECEACRNLELIWLLKGLTPGYRTIADFRKDNWAALKAANRDFVLLVRELGLVGGALVASTARFSMATPARGASRRARGSPHSSRRSTGISKPMVPRSPRTTPRKLLKLPRAKLLRAGRPAARTLRGKSRR